MEIRGLKLILIFVALIMAGCATPLDSGPTPAQTGELAKFTRIKSMIRVETEGMVLHYQNESCWQEDQYPLILGNKTGFSSDLIAKFKEDVSEHGDKDEKVASASVEFNEEKKSTIFTCDIHGAVSRTEGSYRATFSWLLRSLGLDFVDDNFEESSSGLSWQGSVDGVPTNIAVVLPATDGVVYKAWEHPVGHCHAHAWWEISP